ncbi:MAG: hypothetical protein AAGA48_38735 [Myxococcota bacterium]
MSRLSILAREALNELRQGLMTPTVWLLMALLAGYQVLLLSSARYLRELSAVEVARNAPSVVYLLTAGQTFWLLIVWAWVFAQPVLRDQHARINEMVYATPIPVQQLLLARYLGAVGLALVIGVSAPVGIAVLEPLAALGLFPSEALMPTPWWALGQAWLVFVVISAFGLGAGFLAASIRTRSVAGPFALSTVLLMLWIAAIVFVKGAGVDPFLAGILDPSGYAEAETQVFDWTPHEKATSWIGLTPALWINRILWFLIPVTALGVVLGTTTREHLTVGSSAPRLADPTDVAAPLGRAPQRPVATSWPVALVTEARWQLARSVNGPRLWVIAMMFLLICIGGAFGRIIGDAEGPLLPRPELVSPLLVNFFYLIVSFIVIAAVGSVLRRDEVEGFEQILDACPAPDGLRLAANMGVSFILVAGVATIPAIAAMLLNLAWVPDALSPFTPWLYQFGVFGPAIMEVTAFAVLAHAAIRRAGLAYALSAVAVFVSAINLELGLVEYPPFEFGMPAHLELSVLTGWAPWVDRVGLVALSKLVMATTLVIGGSLLLRRGVQREFASRLTDVVSRLRTWRGLALAGALASTMAFFAMQYHRYVTIGTYASTLDDLQSDALWERTVLPFGAPWSVDGGDLRLEVTPGGAIHGTWTLCGLRSDNGHIVASLPEGFRLQRVRRDGVVVPPTLAADSLVISLADSLPHQVDLEWSIANEGWSADDTHWSTSRGVWLRGRHVVPRLGVDRERIVRAPQDRRDQALPVSIPDVDARATTAMDGVAPPGDWHWSVEIRAPQGTVTQHRTSGPLDIAAFWSPQLIASRVGDKTVFSHEHYSAAALEIGGDVAAVEAWLAERLPGLERVDSVVQTPRGWGEPVLVGGILLLPEDHGWDVGPSGPGRTKRRARIGHAIARSAVMERTGLRNERGAIWLSDGLPGALGLLAVEELDGSDAFEALLDRRAQEITQTIAASPVPIASVADAPADSWVKPYTSIAALHWADQLDASALEHMLERATRSLRVGLPASFWNAPRRSDLQLSANGTIEGLRRAWADGGWTVRAGSVEPWRVSDGLWLDAWPSYEKTPSDNRENSTSN